MSDGGAFGVAQSNKAAPLRKSTTRNAQGRSAKGFRRSLPSLSVRWCGGTPPWSCGVWPHGLSQAAWGSGMRWCGAGIGFPRPRATSPCSPTD